MSKSLGLFCNNYLVHLYEQMFDKMQVKYKVKSLKPGISRIDCETTDNVMQAVIYNVTYTYETYISKMN